MTDNIITSDVYSVSMSLAMKSKVDLMCQGLDGITQGLVVDLGCFDNQLNFELEKIFRNKHPEVVFLGIEENPEMINKTRAGKVIFADACNPPFPNESVSAFTLSAVLHELLEKIEIKILLQRLKEKLIHGGRIVIRDPVKPEDSKELFNLKFTRDSEWDIFTRFERGFTPIMSDSNFAVNQKTKTVQMSAWLVFEYLRHRMFAEDGMEQFDHELSETYGRVSLSEINIIAKLLGFTVLISETMNQPSLLERMNRYKDSIEVVNSVGKPLDIASRMPPQMFFVMEKP